jgi:hypothetical protein
MATMDPRIGKRMNQAHPAYTEQTLAHAIRTGVNSEGEPMSLLMPRFELDDDDLAALQTYLAQLSHAWSPGVDEHTVRFATVLTPGIEPARRKVFLDMLHAAVAQKNGSTAPGHRHMVSPAEMLGVTERSWILDVWELRGAPASWGAQLDAYYRAAPVFAIVSGLSSGSWAPVAEFCERQQVPNWFPSVDLVPEPGRYSLYFSRGVALEADVLATALRHPVDGSVPRRVVQVYADAPVGRGAAEALTRALADSTIRVDARVLTSTDPAALRQAVVGLDAQQDVLVLWLDSAALERIAALGAPGVPVYLSGRMTRGLPSGLPASWRARGRMVYPYQLPDQRDANLSTFHTWMAVRQFPQVDEALQAEVFFAVSYLTTTVAEMLDNLYRDYLLERPESMLSLQEATHSVEETRARASAGRPGAMLAHFGEQSTPQGIHRDTLERVTSIRSVQTGSSIYPYLGLGPGQRLASKGAYIVRYADSFSDTLLADSDWIVP